MKLISFFLLLALCLPGVYAQEPLKPLTPGGNLSVAVTQRLPDPLKLRLIVPIGHTHVINSVAFSPDGKYILTGSSDNTAKLWDSRTCKELITFSGHTESVNAVAFSPKGDYVLTGSSDNTARLWTLNGKEIRSIDAQGDVRFVAISPDGKSVLLLRPLDAFFRMWKITGNLIENFKGQAPLASDAVFSPDGQSILAASPDKTAKLLDLTGKVIQTFSGHVMAVIAVAFSPDGKTILTASKDNSIKLWDRSGKEIRTFGTPLGITDVAFSPDGQSILVGTEYLKTILYDHNGRKIQTIESSGNIRSVAFSPNGNHILTGGTSCTAQLWKLNGEKVASCSGHSSGVSTVAFSSDGRYILTANRNNTAKFWDASGAPPITFPTGKGIKPVAFSPDGKYFLAGGLDNVARLWNLAGKPIRAFPGHTGSINTLTFAADGKTILTGSDDNSAKIWDISGKEIRSLKTEGDVKALYFSPDGEFILTADDDNALRKWLVTGQEIQSVKGKFKKADATVFSPDGKFLLTGGAGGFGTILNPQKNKTAKLWDMNGKEVKSFEGHTGFVKTVAFSPDGKWILTGSDDQTVKLWDLTGKQLQVFSTEGEVTSVAMSPEGKFILASSTGHTTTIWDRSGKELATLIALDSADWVVTTPSGLFDASPGAMKLMYFTQGRVIIQLDQIKDRYYEPGLLSAVLGFTEINIRSVSVLDTLALSPDVYAEILNNQLAVTLTAHSGGLGKLSLFINGKEVREDINPERKARLSIDLKQFDRYWLPDFNTITLLAYNREGWQKSRFEDLIYKSPTASKEKPHLYIIAVGTSDYTGSELDLRYPDLDAEAIAHALQVAGKGLFTERVHLRLLTSSGKNAGKISTKANIEAAFREFAGQAKANDIVVVYFSGHGLTYGEVGNEQFYYLTKDIPNTELNNGAIRKNFTVSSDDLTRWVAEIPANKEVLIFDACNAGSLINIVNDGKKSLTVDQRRALERMKDRGGMFILAGSASDKISYESSQYGQGLLTFSLLQGISGLALREGRYVDVSTLFEFALDQVPVLAQGIGGVQKPVQHAPGSGSFDIGLVAEGEIKVTPPKPVFIRNVFQDETSFDDVLGLNSALENYFREITTKGVQAEFIFVDVNEYDNAYSMKGLYKIEDDVVAVRGRLFKGAVSQGEFQVTGKKSDLPGLAEQIVEQVSEMIK